MRVSVSVNVSVSEGLCLPRNLRVKVHEAGPATKSANEPQVQKLRFTAPVTKSERLDDHHHVQSAAPASALRSKAAPIPCACHEKSTLDHQKHQVSLVPAMKSDHHHVRKCTRHHNKSAVARSTRRGHPDFASLRSRNALRGLQEA